MTEYLVHTCAIFTVWWLQRGFPGLLYCAYTYFWKQEGKKRIPTVSCITTWRASSGFTQLYNEMILCLITIERMKCTYVLLCKMLYGWSDMWKQQNPLSSARISHCLYMFEVLPQYFVQWWMFNYQADITVSCFSRKSSLRATKCLY